jgi:NADH-quinone oxidoreductase subunit K
MNGIPLHYALFLAAILFVIGLVGVLSRKNIILMLMSVEIMLNAAGLVFVIAGARWVQADGQVMFIFILTMAAAEVSVGLALVLQMFHLNKSLDVNSLGKMKG